MNKKDLDGYRVKAGQKVDLAKWDPEDGRFFKGKKKDAHGLLQDLNLQLESLQELLYAEHKHKVLIVLQAMDTGGKDGTIRHVFEGVNPQGVKVASFKAPTGIELDHDYLWRIHKRTPGKGEIVIFNRSHYEDVLVVRVHSLVPEKTWMRRFDHIIAFEKMLAEEGTTILKFYLHINLEEQKQRFLSRLETPHKQWKFSLGDLEERKLWPQYIKAFEDVLGKTSTEWAPWYIVPANRKWYRNLLISSIVVNSLAGLKMKYPQPEENLDKVVID
ncbi:MAG: polyphosphate kinase 2 family protein [Candidatus Aminicenantes bacterium]|nr:polyphosphate kinase 2 family protein [Candidatus Aminicenantes bacterium]